MQIGIWLFANRRYGMWGLGCRRGLFGQQATPAGRSVSQHLATAARVPATKRHSADGPDGRLVNNAGSRPLRVSIRDRGPTVGEVRVWRRSERAKTFCFRPAPRSFPTPPARPLDIYAART